MNLLPIWVNPNDIGLTVDLSIEHFQRENALLIFYEILPTGSWRKLMKVFMKTSLKILYVDIKELK